MNKIASGPLVAIIGGGFAGASVAVHLMRRTRRPLRLYIIEPRAGLGAGLAYGTRDPVCRLNVPTRTMYVAQDNPLHFHEWVRAMGLDRADPDALDADGNLFMRRAVFGRYMQDLLQTTAMMAAPRVSFAHLRDEAVGIDRSGEGFSIALGAGERLAANMVLICASHGRPQRPWPQRGDAGPYPGVVDDPWDETALTAIANNAPVLIAGTGLTMADVYASLRARGHRGKVIAVSRRGLIPQTFRRFNTLTPFLKGEDKPAAASALLHAVRAEIRKLGAENWRDVIEACRWNAAELWDALDERGRQRLLRHVRPWWDTHRYRIAPQISAVLEAGLKAGDLELRAGRITALEPITRQGEGRLRVHVRRRREGDETPLEVGAVINCTGPSHDVASSDSPLLRSLLANGLAIADEIGLGLQVDAQCRVLDATGAPAETLRAIGPLTRGRFAEIVGAPEIAVQAETVAAHLFLTALA